MGSLGSEWHKYQALMESRPEAFADTGSIHIVTDPAVVERFQESSGRTIGVVYSSPYHLMVVDLVYEQEGKYFAYERVLPAVQKGAVVIVPRYQGGYLLLKQYRHALRNYQYAFPRGFGEDGISAEENVCKEIREELLAEASNIQLLGACIADSGLCGDKASVYSCDIESFSLHTGYEGISNVIHLTDAEMTGWMAEGKLNDGFTLSAYSLYTAHSTDN